MGPEVVALTIVILLFSVILHEVMHGWVALKFGDRTALNAGRLTLNPLPHIDPIGTILVPVLLFMSGLPLFGWAKPVPVNPLNFKDIRQGELLVSLAGVGANFFLAVVSGLLIHLFGALNFEFIILVLYRAVLLNLSLGLFNLLPIPPLDGSKALMAVLPYEAAKQYQQFERFGFLLLFVLLFFPLTRDLIGGILTGAIGLFLQILRLS